MNNFVSYIFQRVLFIFKLAKSCLGAKDDS